jgi:nuclear cap-binding protein subunit 1
VRVRKQLVAIAENPMRPWHEEAQAIATLFTDNWEDELLRANFVDLVLQLAVEQPLKTPFVAAVVLIANATRPEVVDLLLGKLAALVEGRIGQGEWREAKLYLKLLACLQGCLEGEGVFPVLEELFARAVDLQTASSEDVSLFCFPFLCAGSIVEGVGWVWERAVVANWLRRRLVPRLSRSSS